MQPGTQRTCHSHSKSLSPWVWHGREVRSRSEGNLRQTPVLQVILPDVRETVYRPAEEHGLPWFAPRELIGICPGPGHLAQIHGFVAGDVYSEEMEFKLKIIWNS